MARSIKHKEHHRSDRIGWLRATVLGANDGIVSTASLIVGVASANADRHSVLISGIAGLAAGALSMASGEYVSVSSQADTERADLKREAQELEADPEHEREELAQIYVERGLDLRLAREVADQLTSYDALKSHARDELGITDAGTARPLQAALASAAAFTIGAALPLSVVILSPFTQVIPLVFVSSLLFLISLGMIAARIGGANHLKGALRVGFWGAFAMASTSFIGNLFDKMAL